jgi:hypothetical protein
MYYILIAEHGEPAVARTLCHAGSSTEARRRALAMDIAMHGRRTGRLFYLDEESFIAWRARGKAVGAAPPAVSSEGQPESEAVA